MAVRDHAASHDYPIPDTSIYEHNAHAHAIYDGILYMANCHSSGDWQFKQSVTMALPTVILKTGCLRG
jgi:hypothetical protein